MPDATHNPKHFRRIRSFVRRPGRLTPAQRQALDSLLPRYAIDPGFSDLRQAFARQAGLVVEIGFGNGEALASMAEAEPDKNFVGIEVHEPGVGRLLRRLAHSGLDNVRVAMRDAVDVLEQQCPTGSVSEFRIYFPDPWPKKRHHKRRLIQPTFVAHLAERLTPGGLLHLATDWAPYADWMVNAVATEKRLVSLGAPCQNRPEWRPETHFEQRGSARGHEIFDLLYRRVG